MKRVGWLVVAAALCAAGAAVWWRSGVGQAPIAANDEPTPPPARVASADARATTEYSPATPQDTPPPIPVKDYAARFRASSDLLEFARWLLPAARAGDHVAQFYLFRAFDTCTHEVRWYFGRRGIHQSLEEALAVAAKLSWQSDPEKAQRTYHRCRSILESGVAELGDGDGWLTKASEGGYPVAVVHDVQRQARELARTRSDDPEKREERRQRVATALRSRDPEVIWEIGIALVGYATTAEDLDSSIEVPAWMLVACQRGVDCSPESERVRFQCQFDLACQPYESMTDILRRGSGNTFPEVEARARWINEKIDAGDWEALGF